MAHSIQPWSWLIETLADAKESDTALLKAMITSAPGFSKEPCYKNAKERVALRFLEELSDSMLSDVTAGARLARRTGIDSSKGSEDVLLRLCKEVSAPNDRRRRGTELLKRDVDQFVLQKRACLPKTALDQLKDLVLEGRHPSAISLRERSGLSKANQGQFLGKSRTLESSNKLEAAKRLKLSTNNGEVQPSKQNSIALDLENRNISPQNDHAGKSDPHACQRNLSAGENRRIGIDGNQVTTDNDQFQPLQQNSVAPDPENRNISLQNDPTGKSNTQAFQHNLSVGESRRIDIDGNQITANPSMPPDNGDKMSQEASPECTTKTIQQNIGVNEAAGAGHNGVALETSSDDLIANGGLRFPSSRNPIIHDSELTDCSEQAFCVKCEEGGQLLVCSGNGCPLQVHESCLGSSADLNDKGKFYCPVCSFKRAIGEYNKAKEKLSLAKKALSNFMDRDRQKKQAQIPEGCNGDHRELPEASNANRDHRGPPEARISGGMNCSPDINGGDLVTSRHRNLMKNHVTGADALGLAEIPADFNNGDLPCRDDVSLRRGIADEAEKLRPPGRQGPSHQPGVVADGEEKHSFSRSSAKRRRPSKRYANPCFPYARRTALPWTREEEEILKEAVGRFSSDGQTTHPWAQILEFGSHIFHKTRTPLDLKDKWRNLQKKQKSKQSMKS